MEFLTDNIKLISGALTGLVALWTLLSRSNKALVAHMKAELSNEFASRAQMDAVSVKLDALLSREWSRRYQRGLHKSDSE